MELCDCVIVIAYRFVTVISILFMCTPATPVAIIGTGAGLG